MPRTASLPSWAKAVGPGVIDTFASRFYPEILAELWDDEFWPEPPKEGIQPTDEQALCWGRVGEASEALPEDSPLRQPLQRGEVDQYWLEVAYQCHKIDIQKAVFGTDLAPQRGGALRIIINDDDKLEGRWAQKGKPEGRGVEAARAGKEARKHYQRIRGVAP